MYAGLWMYVSGLYLVHNVSSYASPLLTTGVLVVRWEVLVNYLQSQAVITCTSSQLPVPVEPVQPPGLNRAALVKEVSKDNYQVGYTVSHWQSIVSQCHLATIALKHCACLLL